MNVNKKKLKACAAGVMASMVLLSGCGAKPAAENPSNAEGTADTQATEILFWHSMSGANQEKITAMVDGFNSSQKEYTVVAQNQGKYDESTSKFFNMNGQEGSPAIIQIGEQNVQSMIDSDLIEPLSNLIQDFSYDQTQLLPQVVNFYSVQGTMYAMPFNASTPVLYYNADALKNAGLQEAPATFEDIVASASKISEANNGMKAVGIHAYGYALDQMITNMGGLVVNNDNGRSARTTAVAYQEQILKIFTWIADLIEEKALINYGTSGENVTAGFSQKEFAMFISSSAVAANVMETSDFEVGIMPLPVPAGTEAQGVYAGGGALCVAKGLDAKVREGAMKFMEYATSAEVQATWAGATGYFPINSKSYETQTMKEIYEKSPQMKVAADQLLNSKQTAATAGPLLSQLPQLRNDLQAAEEMVFNGTDPKEAMEQAAKNTNTQIESANAAVAK